MTTYIAQFLDTETDEVLEIFVFNAASDAEAEMQAAEEAEYQGFFLGSVEKS